MEHHEKGTLSHDGAFIANYGVEGSEKLDANAKAFKLKPYSCIVKNTTDKQVQSLSALVTGELIGDVRLDADFYINGIDWKGYVLLVYGFILSA